MTRDPAGRKAEATEIGSGRNPQTHRQVPGRRIDRTSSRMPGNSNGQNLAKYDWNRRNQNAGLRKSKIEEGCRKQIVESACQLWMKSKSDLELATTTHNHSVPLPGQRGHFQRKDVNGSDLQSGPGETRRLPAVSDGPGRRPQAGSRVPSPWSTPPGARCRKWPRCCRTPGLRPRIRPDRRDLPQAGRTRRPRHAHHVAGRLEDAHVVR